MSWYRLEPETLVTRALFGDLAAAAGLRADEVPDAATPLLARLFELTAGLPYADERPTSGKRTAAAQRLLHEAVLHVLAPPGGSRHVPLGWQLDEDGAHPSGPTPVQVLPRVAVNQATVAEFDGLPGIGPGLAGRIVEERRRGGPYTGVPDLAERVDGLSDDGARRLYPLLRFDLPGAPAPAFATDLRGDLARLVESRAGATPVERLLAALDLLVVRAAADRHPIAGELRRPVPPEVPDADTADRVSLLSGRSYYERLTALIESASERVDVCMFHIAMPGQNHPTLRVFDALGAARANGVRVRVLVDRDRRNDPYRSAVINRPAVERLLRARVNVRVDLPERLLHSKFVLLDDDRLVIGSHNWSAGSYFGFDDLSVLIESEAVCRRQRARFNALWRDASPARRPGRR